MPQTNNQDDHSIKSVKPMKNVIAVPGAVAPLPRRRGLIAACKTTPLSLILSLYLASISLDLDQRVQKPATKNSNPEPGSCKM